jgi:hypothetical protein
MRDIDSGTQAALDARAIVARDFIWITGKPFAGGPAESIGFWSDLGTVTATVIDGETGDEVSRDYIGAGTLLAIDDIPLTSDVNIRTINVTLSQISDSVAGAARGYDLKQGPVEIHRGLFDPVTRNLVSAPLPRFVGFIDKCIIVTPQEGAEGSIQLSMTSHTQELTRANSEKCSDDSQQRRAAGDAFYKDVGTVGDWDMFWGQEKGKAAVPSTFEKNKWTTWI